MVDSEIGEVRRNGAGKVIRTPDLRITNALLYQLSYAGTATGIREGAEYRQNVAAKQYVRGNRSPGFSYG